MYTALLTNTSLFWLYFIVWGLAWFFTVFHSYYPSSVLFDFIIFFTLEDIYLIFGIQYVGTVAFDHLRSIKRFGEEPINPLYSELFDLSDWVLLRDFPHKSIPLDRFNFFLFFLFNPDFFCRFFTLIPNVLTIASIFIFPSTSWEFVIFALFHFGFNYISYSYSDDDFIFSEDEDDFHTPSFFLKRSNSFFYSNTDNNVNFSFFSTPNPFLNNNDSFWTAWRKRSYVKNVAQDNQFDYTIASNFFKIKNPQLNFDRSSKLRTEFYADDKKSQQVHFYQSHLKKRKIYHRKTNKSFKKSRRR